IDLNSLPPSAGTLLGAATNYFTGAVISSGDLNGDGVADLVVSSSVAPALGRGAAGIVYVIYGPDSAAPTAALPSAPPVTDQTTDTSTYLFTVTYNDNGRINAGTLGNADVRVTGPHGFNQLATLVAVTPPGNGSRLTATYRITPPRGKWHAEDKGTY